MVFMDETVDFLGGLVSRVRFWASGSKGKQIQVLQLALLLLAVPIGIIFFNQRVQFFGKAAEFSARLDLPAEVSAKVGQEFTVAVTLGSGEAKIEKVKAVLRIRDFDARKFSSNGIGVITLDLPLNEFKGSGILTSLKFKGLTPGKYYVDFDPTSSTVLMSSNPPKNILNKMTNMMVTVEK